MLLTVPVRKPGQCVPFERCQLWVRCERHLLALSSINTTPCSKLPPPPLSLSITSPDRVRLLPTCPMSDATRIPGRKNRPVETLHGAGRQWKPERCPCRSCETFAAGAGDDQGHRVARGPPAPAGGALTGWLCSGPVLVARGVDGTTAVGLGCVRAQEALIRQS